jgi:hypothetical protein
MGTTFRVLAALLLVGLLAGVGFAIYNAGVSQGLVTTAASGAPLAAYPNYYPGFHFGWAFFPFGILFWILGIFLIIGLVRAAFFRPRWGGPMGRGPWGPGGPGGWGHESRRQMLEEWHREAHGEAHGEAPPKTGEQPKDG